jgi:hypothetical protein
MDHVAVRVTRTGAVALLATVLICGVCREGAAQVVEHNSNQPRESASRGHGPSATPVASSEHQAKLGPMRYYGGPKSPMWRGPAAD